MLAAHLVPQSSQRGAQLFGITDLWSERNGFLWCEPIERAYTFKHVIFLIDSPLIMRVLTDECYNSRLVDFVGEADSKLEPAFRKHRFADFDNKVIHLRSADCMPFRRVLLSHAARSLHERREQLRTDVQISPSQLQIDRPSATKPETVAWLEVQLQGAGMSVD